MPGTNNSLYSSQGGEAVLKDSWQFSRSRSKSEKFLEGAIDLHVHPGPHLFSSPRSTDPIKTAIEARDAGMRAFAIMDVFNMSVGTAWMVQQVVEGIEVYGGIILNTVFGGMNPRAVKTAIYYGSGARYVTFGAHSTYYQAYKEGRYDDDGKWILLREKYPKFVTEELDRCVRIPEGEPTPELKEILEVIAANPQVYLETGHVSNQEAFRLLELGKQYGIKKLVVSNAVVENMTDAEIQKAIDMGAWIERLLAAHTHTTPIPKTHYYVEPEYRAMDEGLQSTTHGGVARVAEQIKKFGADHFFIGTDFGVYTLPTPVEGFREFIACLMDLGLSDEEIRKVSSINPGKLVDLND
jgi:hypothetical protein